MGPQYTSCVEPGDFQPLNKVLIAALVVLIVAGGIAAIFTAGIGALIAIASLVQLLRYALNFMLNGKLICLHRNPSNLCLCSSDGNTVCAIGEVADTENVGEDKNPVEDVDNDYAMNVILAPFNMRDFANNDDRGKNLAIATASTQPQGDLVSLQPGMPQEDGKPKWSGYFRTMVLTQSDGNYRAWTEIVGRDYGWTGIIGPDQQKQWSDYVFANAWLLPKKFPVPVLHCEFEGTRIRDVLDAIEAFSLGGGWCKKNWFFGALCVILQSILAPFALAAAGIAWAAAKDGSAADALEGGGTIDSKDQVVVRGRWTYDGGHDGWNEIHATRIVQKVDYIPADPKGFDDFRKRWCDLLSEVPHVDPSGSHPQSPADSPPLTPGQQIIYDNQQRPENRWTLHPEVDGCEPASHQPPVIR